MARHAGVSPSTVSYALSGKRPISDETRQRIERSIQELGYHPHAGARALASSRSNVLALVIPLRTGIHVPVADLNGLSAWLAYSSFLERLDLAQVEADYARLLA